MKLILRHGTATVAAAGTRVRLTSLNIVTPAVVIQAPATNTLRLYIGDKTVSSTNSFVSLASGGSCEISAAQFGMADAGIKLSDIWIDVGTNGDKATFGWLERASED